MRLNEQEPAAVVLDRLGMSKPQPSSDPKRPDLSYPERLKAWEAAVERETKRDQEEKAGTYQDITRTTYPELRANVMGSGTMSEITEEMFLQAGKPEITHFFTPEVVPPTPSPRNRKKVVTDIVDAQARTKSKAPRRNKGRRSRPPRKMKPRSPRRR